MITYIQKCFIANQLRILILGIAWMAFAVQEGAAQSLVFKLSDAEEAAYASFSAKEWLETAAAPALFVLIQPTEISRIVTLCRKPGPEQAPITLKLVNKTGDFTIGTWEARIEEIPNTPKLVYCIFDVGKNAPPGRYEALSNAPELWLNAAATDQRGMIWVLSKRSSLL